MRARTADTAAERRRGRADLSPRLRSVLIFTAATILFAAIFILPDLLQPDRAEAIDIPVVSDVADAAQDLIGKGAEKLGETAMGPIKDAFLWMLNMLFGGIQATLSIKLLTWLTTMPDFSGGQVAKIGRSLQIAAGAFLTCILTLSIIRFWLGSYTSSGNASSGIEGVIRTAIAALLIGLWPKLFSMGVSLTNAFSTALLNDAAKDRLQKLFAGLDMASLGIPAAGAAAGGAVGLFVGAGISILVWIIVSTASVVLFLGLIIMKIMVTAGTVIAFVAMPLALVLWPIPETSWIAGMLAKAIAVLLAIPVIWILVFSAASAIGSDVFFLSNNGKNADFLGTGLNILLIKPLVACALLYLAIMLPNRLMRMVPLAGGARVPGSNAARAVTSYATYRSLDAVASSTGARAGIGAATSGFKKGFNPPAQTEMTGTGFKAEGWKGNVQDKAQQMGGKARGAADQAKSAAGSQGGKAAGAAAGGYVAGAAGAAAGSKIGEQAGTKASQAVPSAAQSVSENRSDIPISKFETASATQKNAQGGPLPMGSTERTAKVDAEHQRMRSMDPAERPTQAQTQQAWNQLGDSPNAQKAIRNVSADPANGGETPRELADWSVDTKNTNWGAPAENATRTIGEASPEVRESVVTDGKGYGWATAGANGGQTAGGNGSAATARPAGGNTKAVPNATEGQKKPAMRRGES